MIGATGYAGAELLRVLGGHPELDVEVAASRSAAREELGSVYPSLRAAYPGTIIRPLDAAAFDPAAYEGLDVVFLALPHGLSAGLVRQLVGRARLVIDLGADFRFTTAKAYEAVYGGRHEAPDLLAEAVYGLPELAGDKLCGARLVAVGGCYVTAAGLALAPFVEAGAVGPGAVVVDAASGTSGAGRKLQEATQFSTAGQAYQAYGLLDHRHRPEMEQLLDRPVMFTPHLAPMTRGILATCYAKAVGVSSTADAMTILSERYRGQAFVQVVDGPPSTKHTLGSNCAHVTARYDPATGYLLSICAIDNLLKGAAGQAVQCANIGLGLTPTLGLPLAGVYP
ncbi:MAG: N-acetyl-gamma-glutamyl-phosphate reductase [Acidimicrobiales bacterium]